MSKTNSIHKIKENIKYLKSVDLSILSFSGSSVQGYPNHSKEDIESLIEDTSRILFSLENREDLLEGLSFEYLNGIEKTLNNFVAQFKPIENLKQEQLRNQHHNPLNQLKALNNAFRQYGIYSILTPSVNIPQIEKQLKDLSGEAAIIVKEAKDNAKIIRDLIPDATSTSLSKAFRTRVSKLKWTVRLWLGFVIAILVSSAWFSWEFLSLDKIVDNGTSFYESQPVDLNHNDLLDTTAIKLDEVGRPNEVKPSSEENSFVYWLKRIVVFLPIFYLIVFAIRQYNKERKLLEIYTHKEAIAQTLPAYMEQAKDNETTRSEILLRGSSMIFTLPENPDTPIQGTDGIAINELKSFLQVKNEMK